MDTPIDKKAVPDKRQKLEQPLSLDQRKAFRGEILHFIADPSVVVLEQSYEYFEDGILVVKDGFIEDLGHAKDLLKKLPDDIEITHYQNGLIMPGFIDTHVHYPQTEMIASYGEQLLEWLENYTFPMEREFSDKAHGLKVAEFFFTAVIKSRYHHRLSIRHRA
ncbi:MAG: amidohydrolase family protein [Enterobacterales bacterium]|nr:amidohydrolase family protein [Enterobacterales bacterium]